MPKEHKPKSPSGPAPALPASVEQSYRQKCKELKKRILEIEGSNDHLTSHIQRARRSIQRMRLERAFLLEQLEKRTDARVEDSEGSPSPPPTPSQKPLRVKRPRKDAPPADSPMRQGSESPGPGGAAYGETPTEYGFIQQSFTHPGETNSPCAYPLAALVGSGGKTAKTTAARGSGARARGGGPKRPPNAYMIFCERERDAVRERESHNENFDMHKALAQAWRDLKSEGQKPYFDEYEKHKAKYNQTVSDLRDHGAGSIGGHGQPLQGKRAASVGSSVMPGSNYDGAASPAPGSTNDEAEEGGHFMSDSAFTAVNRSGA